MYIEQTEHLDSRSSRKLKTVACIIAAAAWRTTGPIIIIIMQSPRLYGTITTTYIIACVAVSVSRYLQISHLQNTLLY